MEAGVPEKLKKNVRAVLLSSPKGVKLQKFCGDYYSLVKERFPCCGSPFQLLQDMPNVVRYEFSAKHNDYWLYGIADSSCYLPSWLRKSQVSTGKNQPSTPPLPQKSPPKKALPSTKANPKRCHKRDLVTVHVAFKHGLTTKTDDTGSTIAMMKRKLPELMEVAGTPKDIYIDNRGFAFVRFASLKEAQRAIELCSNTSVGNTRIIVCPAKESQELFASRPVSDAASLEAGRSEGPVCLQSQRGSEEVGRRGGGGKGGGGRGGGAVGISATPSMQRYGADCTSTSRDGACPLLTHSASTLGDVTSKSRDASPRSDDQSDLDSDFWDEDLLTSIRDLIPIPCRAVPVPVLQPNQRYAGLSPRNTPNEQGLTLVHVSLVESPNLIWLQLTSDPEQDIAKLSEWISCTRPPGLTQMWEGKICCLKTASEGFWRVQVQTFDNCITRQQATVVFVDTGQSRMVACSQLHVLPLSLSLTSVPPLAMACGLAGVRSTFSGGAWYFLDNQLLWKYLTKKQMYVRKISCPPSSNSLTHANNLPQVKVDMYFDSTGKSSVANLLVATGIHVVFESDVTASHSDTVKTAANASSAGSAHVHKTGFAMISKSVHMTESGGLEPHLPHHLAASSSTPQGVGGECSDSFTNAAEEEVSAGEGGGVADHQPHQGHPPQGTADSPVTVKHSYAVPQPPASETHSRNHPLHSQRLSPSLSPPPLTTSQPPLAHSVTPSHHHNPPNTLSPNIKSPFLRLQKLVRSFQTNTADYSY